MIQPQLTQQLTYAKARYESIHGLIVSGWSLEDDQLKLEVRIPANTTATVKLPDAVLSEVLESGRPVGSG